MRLSPGCQISGQGTEITLAYFGEYNQIYFIKGGHGLAGIRDRAHRGETVTFAEEPLEDLGTEPCAERGLIRGQQVFGQVAIGGTLREAPFGCHGRALEYSLGEPEGPGHITVRLSVSLPALTRYRIRWESAGRHGDTFELGHGITLTVHTDLPWDYRDCLFTVETASDEGEVVFVVESRVTLEDLSDRVIVAAEGHEREAVIVRATCGRGFVPSFVVTAQEWSDPSTLPRLLDGLACSAVIGVGLPAPAGEPRFVRADPGTGEWPGAPRPEATLTAPDRPDAYGPALYLAIRNGARLVFDSAIGERLRLDAADGTLLDEWPLTHLIGVPLPGPDDSGELVICESTPADLLICQAVGYADTRARPLAFLPPIDTGHDGFSGAASDAIELEKRAAQAVPASLRRPDAGALTIFTRDLPLHLTPVSDTDRGLGRWMDHYTLAHLPGRTGSILVPRSLHGLLDRAPEVPVGVVFDALETFASTEGEIYSRQLAEGLAHPLVLSGPRARLKSFQEVLERIETDLILVIAHGQDDHFDDHDNEEISSALISTWKLRGRPLVFNNSCSSWKTSGEAFLSAGARAVIGTLWPIDNDQAAAIGTRIGELLHATSEADVPDTLSAALREAGEHYFETAASYVYVGLPGVTPLSAPAISDGETIELLAAAFNAFFSCVKALLAEGEVETALTLQTVVVASLRQRFAALVQPGEWPLHLPVPWGQFTVLDAECLLGLANLSVGRELLPAVPRARQHTVVKQMCDLADRVLRELLTWDERHESHNGYSFTEADRAAWPLPLGALTERGFYELGARFALNDVLPLVDALLRLRSPELREDALRRYELAAKLVTVPDDLESDGSITDAALIRRIRTGTPDRLRGWSREGDDRELTMDLLAHAVGEKAELANRFGMIRLRLEEYEAAAAFFQAARDLATPGSAAAVNATSNLATARGPLAADGVTDAGHRAAFDLQLAADDPGNALITAANLLRQSAKGGHRVDDGFLAQAMALSERIASPSLRIAPFASLLGALSVYHARFGDHTRAAAASATLTTLLHHPQPEPARHLNELAEWYYQHGHFARGAACGLSTARVLDRARLPEAAVFSYLQAANSALEAHGGRGRKRFLRLFLECADRLGYIARAHPQIATRFEEELADVLENTRGLWSQFADLGLRGLALLAYEAQKAWPDGETEESWEALSHAFHPRNLAFVRRLAALGLLRRGGVVQIGPNLQVRVAKVTLRREGVPSESGTVYCTMPLHGTGHVAGTANVMQVSGGTVCRLGPGETAIVSEEGVQATLFDWGGDSVYREIWGSRIFTYGLTINVEPGLAVKDVQCARMAGSEPEVTVQNRQNGTVIEVTAAHPWLATVSMTVGSGRR